MTETTIKVDTKTFSVNDKQVIVEATNFDTIDDLRAASKVVTYAKVLGYHSKGDNAFGSDYYEWVEGSTLNDDGGRVIKAGTLSTGRFVLHTTKNFVDPKWYGAVPIKEGQRVEDAFDSTGYIFKANDSLYDDEILGGGFDDIFRIEGNNASSNNLNGKGFNLSLKSAAPATFGNIKSGRDYNFKLEVDGNRGNFTETWSRMTAGPKATSLFGIKSIQPATGAFIKSNTLSDGDVTMEVKATNMFNVTIVLLHSKNKIIVNKWEDHNLANKGYHFWHGLQTDSTWEVYPNGKTVVNCTAIFGENGILPDSFEFKDSSLANDTEGKPNVDESRTVTFGENKMPQNQGAFNGIVTFGQYYMPNGSSGGSYGATSVCSDRNEIARLSGLHCVNREVKGSSNNPAGMFWTEQTKEVYLTDVYGEIEERSVHNKGDESIVALWGNTGQLHDVDRAVVKTNDYELNRPIRCSSSGGATWKFNDIKLYGNSHSTEHGFSLGYFHSVTKKDNVIIQNSEFNTQDLNIAPCESLVIRDTLFNLTGQVILAYDSGTTGITEKTDLLILDGVRATNKFTLNRDIGTLIITNSVFESHLNITKSVDNLVIGDDVIIGGRLVAPDTGIASIKAYVVDEATSDYMDTRNSVTTKSSLADCPYTLEMTMNPLGSKNLYKEIYKVRKTDFTNDADLRSNIDTYFGPISIGKHIGGASGVSARVECELLIIRKITFSSGIEVDQVTGFFQGAVEVNQSNNNIEFTGAWFGDAPDGETAQTWPAVWS